MSIGYWVVAGIILAPLFARTVRRLVGVCLRGRSLRWRVHLRGDLRLAARGLRLRLYGIDGSADPAARAALVRMLGQPVMRLRVIAIDGDGTLVVVMRGNGRNAAVALLRAGLVRTRGTGARRYRQAQAAAQLERRGLWRLAGIESQPPMRSAASPALVFPWWQG